MTVTAMEMAVVAETERVGLLQAWDLRGPQYRVIKSYPSWSEGRLNRAMTGYRQFLYLEMIYPEVRLVPHIDMDEVWHEHILHTRDYAAMCEAVLGRFLHHEPSPGGVPTERDRKDYAHMRALIRHHFGADKDPQTWLGQNVE